MPYEEPARVIIDLSGNDTYKGEGLFSLGGSLLSTSILIDSSGNDIYEAGPNSLGSAVFGLGLLLDEGGDDTYREASIVRVQVHLV